MSLVCMFVCLGVLFVFIFSCSFPFPADDSSPYDENDGRQMMR